MSNWFVRICCLFLILFCPLFIVGKSLAQPVFSKVFVPDAIGPGSVSTLTFTIDNTYGTPVTDLAFTDVLPTVPGAMVIADPANASTTCIDAVLSATPGGGTITLSDGNVGASANCIITVDITASTPGVHTNTSGDLTSSVGNSGTASDDLTVTTTLPGFSKSFSPSSVNLGGRSTLTFTIDNSANPSRVGNLEFTDNLPTGLLIADPANASTDCVSAGVPDTTLTADPGTNVISLDANGSNLFAGFEVLPIGATCTVIVDVVATGNGTLVNNSGELLADFVSSGKATDTLVVTREDLHITKSFTDDPLIPGGTVTLEFVISNYDRINAATNVSFTDDLTTIAPTLTGLTFASLLSNDCGGSVSGVGGTTIALSGGTIAPQGSCTVQASLTDTVGAASGIYTNTTEAVEGNVGGSMETGNTASDDLFIQPVPTFTKSFTDDPVFPNGDVTLEYTITNTSAGQASTDIAFTDELTTFLPFPLSVTLPPVPDPPCGVGSSLGFTFPDIDRQAISLSDGTLGAGESCTFSVTVTIPGDLTPGQYLSTSEEIAATVGGTNYMGSAASDTLVVGVAPVLSKSFTDDPVAPGETVTLEFTIDYGADGSGDATNLTFTDDLNTVLAGLAPAGPLPTEPCGTGSTFTYGGTTLTLSGGSLSPGESCTFNVTLDVPGTALSGSNSNTTSTLSSEIATQSVTSQAATDDLDIAGIIFSKEFIPGTVLDGEDDSVLPGQTINLRFTIENIHPTLDATLTFFTDNLQLELAGLAATGVPTSDDCGGTLSGTTFLTYVGGSVDSGMSCTIDVPVLVPSDAADGIYLNTTSFLTINQGGGANITPATAMLTVNSERIELVKEFTDDPVNPGGTATLEFRLTNLDATNAISQIGFTDDLDAALSGATITAPLPTDPCGDGSSLSFDGTTLTLADGVLTAGGDCTFSVIVDIPNSVSGTLFTNTTSGVTGVSALGSTAVTGSPASDELNIYPVIFTKAFTEDFDSTFDPSIKGTEGEYVTVEFTITNSDTTASVSSLQFLDVLDGDFAGFFAEPGQLPYTDICGSGSSLTESIDTGVEPNVSTLSLSGGSLGPGESCTIVLDLIVSASAPDDTTITNATSDLRNEAGIVSPATSADLLIDHDLDDDGVNHLNDNCQFVANSGQEDWNMDGEGDACDDSDSDTIVDSIDNCRTVPNTSQTNSDMDSHGDACDNCDITDNEDQANNDSDSFGDVCDNCPTATNEDQADGDSDTVGDVCDNCPATANTGQENGDTDSFGDVCDNCPTTTNEDQADGDSDTVGDVCDNCPAIANTGQENGDTDSIGDVCDNCPATTNEDQADGDSDTVGDVCDNCPTIANTGQANNDADTLGDVCDNCPTVDNQTQINSDGDSLGDSCDNCPDATNEDQANNDSDTLGNACDNCPDITNQTQVDTDEDARGDVCDNCPAIPNDDQVNSDGDSLGDECDNCPEMDNEDQADSDSDSAGDVCDNCPADANSDQKNSDDDTSGDVCDEDDDNDGVLDGDDNCVTAPNENQHDFDGDGDGNVCDPDSDNDGIPNSYERDTRGLNPYNAADAFLDFDGDGWNNLEEYFFNTDPHVANVDLNGNGIPDITDAIRGNLQGVLNLLRSGIEE